MTNEIGHDRILDDLSHEMKKVKKGGKKVSESKLINSTFLQYYFLTLCFLSFIGFLAIGLVILNHVLPIPMTTDVRHSFNQKNVQAENLEVQDEGHTIQNYSGETLTYDVNLKVTKEDGKVVQTYIYQYQK